MPKQVKKPLLNAIKESETRLSTINTTAITLGVLA